jgi:hypothetical protein
MCKYSHIFQIMVKNSEPDELTKWFHSFVKDTFNPTLHSECDKKINNLRSMIKAISHNNGMNINDLEYSRKISNI